MKHDLDLEKKKETNIWDDNIDEVISFIKKATEGGLFNMNKPWKWTRNSLCKYIELRIDMRDGGFILKNDRGERISLKQLQYQYKSGDENDQDYLP
jgi:hypothetical protein